MEMNITDKVNNDKILIGSLFKNLTEASKTGSLDLKPLYLYSVIAALLKDCNMEVSFKQRKKLKEVLLALKYRYKNFCTYRFNNHIDYANVIGCCNCKDLNNNPYKVKNTAPTVNDDEIPLPKAKPLLTCDSTKEAVKLTYVEFTLLDFIKCYDANGTSSYKYLKVTEFPTTGFLVYNNEGFWETLTGEIEIDLTAPGGGSAAVIRYYPIVPGDTSFKFTVSNSDSPVVFADPVNMFINYV